MPVKTVPESDSRTPRQYDSPKARPGGQLQLGRMRACGLSSFHYGIDPTSNSTCIAMPALSPSSLSHVLVGSLW